MKITRKNGYTSLWLSANDTFNWAHKPNASWPCSTLSGKRLFAQFDSSGDIVDLTINGRNGDCDAREFNAITFDFAGLPSRE